MEPNSTASWPEGLRLCELPCDRWRVGAPGRAPCAPRVRRGRQQLCTAGDRSPRKSGGFPGERGPGGSRTPNTREFCSSQRLRGSFQAHWLGAGSHFVQSSHPPGKAGPPRSYAGLSGSPRPKVPSPFKEVPLPTGKRCCPFGGRAQHRLPAHHRRNGGEPGASAGMSRKPEAPHPPLAKLGGPGPRGQAPGRLPTVTLQVLQVAAGHQAEDQPR